MAVSSKKLSEKEKRERVAALKVRQNKDKEMVKGIFRYHEVPGGSLSFSYRFYKGQDVERYDLVDGQMATVPLGVARHLNTSGKYPIHEYARGENGKPDVRIGKMVSRYSFQSLEFIDDLAEIDKPDLVTIEFADGKKEG